VVYSFQLGEPFGAEISVAQGRIGVSLDPGDLSIFEMNQKPAAPVIHPGTIGLDDHRKLLISSRFF
jgi:hypothetical protein